MQKIRYELDPYNRLIAYGPAGAAETDLPEFRAVLDGRFRTDGNNYLSYHVKTPLPEGEKIPNQIRLKGEWSLTGGHELRFTLDKSARTTFGDRITLQGEILDVRADCLMFAVTTTTKEAVRSTYVLELGGVWKADESNRLSFHVKKELGRSDILTFDGIWEIGENYQIVYSFEKADLIRKKRTTHTLIFKGAWDISGKGRISYVLSRDTDSVFDFQASAGIFKEDHIQYEVGIGAAGRRKEARRIVTLFGAWNIRKGVGLVFQIQYENGKAAAIVFGADAKVSDTGTVSFRLRGGMEDEDIGATLELSHAILQGDGEAFLRALTSRKELSICAGAAWRW